MTRRRPSRLRAIGQCCWYGIVPWRLYERKRHYHCTYARHLRINLGYAIGLATFRTKP